MESEVIVYIVDDDPAIRHSVTRLLESVGLHVEAFGSASEFLDRYDPDRCACLVLDLRLPGMSGLELQKTLRERSLPIPVIFLTGFGDVPMAVQAMRAGAIDVIEKPFRHQALLDRIQEAMTLARQRDRARRRQADIRERFSVLTRREREVMDLVVDGRANKEVALALGVSLKTVEFHRTNVMKKLDVDGVARLVRLVLSSRSDGGHPEAL